MNKVHAPFPVPPFRYVLSVTASTTILMRIAIPEKAGPFPSGRPAINVSLFAVSSEGGGDETVPSPAAVASDSTTTLPLDPLWKPTSSLASTNKGIYMDASGGVASTPVVLGAGKYVVIVSTYTPQEVDYALTVYSGPESVQLQRMA